MKKRDKKKRARKIKAKATGTRITAKRPSSLVRQPKPGPCQPTTLDGTLDAGDRTDPLNGLPDAG